MKVFFIIPPNLHYMEPYAYVKVDKSNVIRPSLGLLYVAAVLRSRSHHEIRIIDSNADNLTLADLENIISSEAPDVIGFSVLTFNLLNCIEVCKIIRKFSPKTKICFGGWHPTLYPKETMKLNYSDFIVMGEGEITFSELIAVLEKDDQNQHKELSSINGLGFRSVEGEIKLNPSRELIKNLDELPLPAYDLIDTKKYSNLLACTGNVITLMTSRGCPQKCIFCDQRQTQYRFRSPENILKEFEYWVKQGVKEFFIQDDNFTINRNRTLKFCNLLIEAGFGIQYKISSRVDYLYEELIGPLKKSGCYRIYFGVESGSQKTLDYLEKRITTEQTRNVFKIAKKYNIDRFAYIMIGVPSETNEDIAQTVNLIKEIGPEHLHCSICTPMPKTYLYQKMLDAGEIKNDYWLEFAKKPDCNFKTPFASQIFNTQELRRMQNEIQKKFYFSPSVILKELLRTKNLGQFVAKGKMAFSVLFK